MQGIQSIETLQPPENDFAGELTRIAAGAVGVPATVKSHSPPRTRSVLAVGCHGGLVRIFEAPDVDFTTFERR